MAVPSTVPTAAELHEFGRTHGLAWARSELTSDQNVANLYACWMQLDKSGERMTFDPDASHYTPAERIALMTFEEDPDDSDRPSCSDFWDAAARQVPIEALNDEQFLRGWIEGALS